MRKVLRALAAAAVLAAAPSLVEAAPLSVTTPLPNVGSADIVQVHHRNSRHFDQCRQDSRGWHTHNRRGERRSCNHWNGRGHRPRGCFKVGSGSGGVWWCP